MSNVSLAQIANTPAYIKAYNALQHRNTKRLLNMLSGAEGADYNTLFGGGTFNSYDKHPDRVVKTKRYASAAAGKYQIMPGTSESVSKELGLKDFSPLSQDLSAVHLMLQRGVDPTQPITRQMVAKLAPEWASLPTMSGNSYYGQPVKTWDELMKFYNSKPSIDKINLIKNDNSPQPEVPTIRPTTPKKKSTFGLTIGGHPLKGFYK